MNRVEKTGWVVLGMTLLIGLVSVGIFIWLGPGRIQQKIRHLSQTDVYEKVLIQAIQLSENLPDKAIIRPNDPRGSALAAALHPANFSLVYKDNRTLTIECGGGFQHYGFKLVREADSRFTFYFQNEGSTDKILKSQSSK